MKTIKTWLPVFPGFYNTEWEPGSLLSEHCREEGQPDFPWWDHFDNGGYSLECVEACAEVLQSWLPEESGVTAVRVENVVSPKEYNFVNDSANIEIDLVPETFTAWIRGYLAEHADAWEAYLLRHYKSRDGFISYYPYGAEDWEADTENFSQFDKAPDAGYFARMLPQHWPGAVLNFYLENSRGEDVRWELYESASGDVYAPQFLDMEGVKA